MGIKKNRDFTAGSVWTDTQLSTKVMQCRSDLKEVLVGQTNVITHLFNTDHS